MPVYENCIYEYYSSVTSKKIDWLWYPYIPFGKLTIIQGDPGCGKSTFILDIISRLSNGKNMPDGFKVHKSVNVIYQCFEDDVSDTIKPRLESAGANCSKVAYIKDNNGFLSLDDKRIEESIKSINAGLLVLDPIQSFLQEYDIMTMGKIRNTLGNLVRIANSHNCAIVLIGHLNKSNNTKNIYRGLGSIDITAIARSVLMIERDENDPYIRFVYPIKSSLAVEGNCIEFQITNKQNIRWNSNKDFKASKSSCRSILIEVLSEGIMPSSDVIEFVKNKGFSERTIYTEKKKLNIKSVKFNNKWFWQLSNEHLPLEVTND